MNRISLIIKKIPVLVPVRHASFGLEHQNKIAGDLKYKNASTKDVYSYEMLCPWKSLGEFSEFMISSIVYKKDNLIAINKPFGVKSYQSKTQGSKTKAKPPHLSSLKIKDFPYSIEDTKSALKDHLNVTELFTIKSAEQCSSGIVIMGTDDKAVSEVSRSRNIAKQKSIPIFRHNFITAGLPVVLNKQEKVGLHRIEVNGVKQPVIADRLSRNACKHREMQSVAVDYSVLTSNPDAHASLVEIGTTSIKWYFVRVYAANRIASILGDKLFGNRMSSILGLPVNVSPFNISHNSPQKLPEQLMQKLQLRQESANYLGIPTMLHLKSVFLPSYHGEDVTITAEPPPHFEWTCARFNLDC